MAAVLAGIGAFGGVLLHLIGITTHQTYFRQWGLDAEMFPKAADVTVVLGYRAMWDAMAKGVIGALVEHWMWWLLYGLLIGGAMWGIAAFDKVPGEQLKGWATRHRRWLNVAFALGVGVFSACIFVPLTLLTVVLVLALPISVGDQYGKTLVQAQLSDFKRGCDNPASHAKCAALLKDDRTMERGFLIAASNAHVALYDPASNRISVHERAGFALRGAPNWLAYPADWKAGDIK